MEEKEQRKRERDKEQKKNSLSSSIGSLGKARPRLFRSRCTFHPRFE